MRAARLPAFCLLALALSLVFASRAGALYFADAPDRVSIGEKLTVRVASRPKDILVQLRIQPSSTPPNRIGLDGAIIDRNLDGKRPRTDDRGRVTFTFRFPRRRLQCGVSCGGHAPWKKGTFVTFDVPGFNGDVTAKIRRKPD